MEQRIGSNPRIEVVDALRGLAVMAIILVHTWNILFSRSIRLILLAG
jgi:peptidoglycan/LPS O-acetylase OafA/YrhL